MINLLECTPIAQYVIGIDHKIIVWNKACEQLTGFTADEMLNTANQWMAFYENKRPVLADLILEQDFEKFKSMYKGKNPAISEIVPYAWEATDFFPEMNKKARYIYFLAAPVFNDKGIMTGAVSTLQDVTHQKQLEIEIKNESEQLHHQNLELKSSIKERYIFCDIIGKSQKMQSIYDLIMNAASVLDNVIIYGESGSGKELVARAIHKMSSRHDKIFIPVNCGAIPENLLETEFFGHVKGAFSGAHTDRSGVLDLADGGTLFLDEIGEISLPLQVKLLRALEGGGYSPVGSNEIKHSDFRIVAATNRNLHNYVETGKMRSDFFYRIHVIPIHIPPLRERKEDLSLLMDKFLKEIDDDLSIDKIPGELMEKIYSHDWPGNVRELQNVLKRFASIGEINFLNFESNRYNKPSLKIGKEPVSRLKNDKKKDCLRQSMRDHEKNRIIESLIKNRWHRSDAAKALGISRRTLFRKIKQYGLISPNK